MFKDVDLINIGMELNACVMKEKLKLMGFVDHVQLAHFQILKKPLVSVKAVVKFMYFLRMLV